MYTYVEPKVCRLGLLSQSEDHQEASICWWSPHGDYLSSSKDAS